MQCNQPLFCAGFQNNAQFSPYHTQPYSDIIGEGDVMSYTLPDGSVQCYFVPINRRERWIPHWSNSCYIPNSFPNNKEAWFVRSILNAYPAPGHIQLSNNYGETFTRCNAISPSCGFVQKFHNDGWTSTTDLHYFFPSLRHDWAKGCAAIQVEIPHTEKTIYHYGTICNRPCYCNHKVENPKVGIKCMESDCTETPMCVDEVKSTHSCCDDARKKEKNRSKNKNHSCHCSRVADKVVTTCADQAISCTDMRCCSQAGKLRSLDRVGNETGRWYARRRKSKRNASRSSSKVAASDSAFCLSCTCSDTDQLASQ